MGFLKAHHILSLVLALMVIVGAGTAYYYYNQYQNTQSLLKNPNLAVSKETNQLVAQVGKLMDLPKNETPTVATVTDASKLKNQPFFQNAKNGDKVLIYVNARKAILYDPTANKIVDVAPVNISQNQAVAVTPTVSPKPTQAPTLAPVTSTSAPSPTGSK